MARGTLNAVRLASPQQGVDGRTIIAKARAPFMTDGRIGDFFIDTVGKRLYGPKNAAAWPDNGLIKGDGGWSPVFGAVTDGARRVQRIVDWQGGAGQKPPVGDYIGPAGLVDTATEAVDIRGVQGPQSLIDGLDEATVAIGDETLISTAQSGNDNEKRVAVEVFDLGGELPRTTIAHAQSSRVRKQIGTLIVRGYGARNDGGGANYRRVLFEPAHPGKIRTLDRHLPDGTTDTANGGWWEIFVTTFDPRMLGAVPGEPDSSVKFQAMIDAMPVGGMASLHGQQYNFNGVVYIGKFIVFDYASGSITGRNQFLPCLVVHNADGIRIRNVNMASNFAAVSGYPATAGSNRIDSRKWHRENNNTAFNGAPSYWRSSAIFVYDTDDFQIEINRIFDFMYGVAIRGETAGSAFNSKKVRVVGRGIDNCDFGVMAQQIEDWLIDVEGTKTTRSSPYISESDVGLPPHLVYVSYEGTGSSSSPNGVVRCKSTDNQFDSGVKLKRCPNVKVDCTVIDMCGSIVLEECPGFEVIYHHASDIHPTAQSTAQVLTVHASAGGTVRSYFAELRAGVSNLNFIALRSGSQDVTLIQPVMIDTRQDDTGAEPVKVAEGSHRCTVINPIWRSQGKKSDGSAVLHDEPFLRATDSDDLDLRLPKISGSSRIVELSGTSARAHALLDAGLLQGGYNETNGFRNIGSGTGHSVSWAGNPAISRRLTDLDYVFDRIDDGQTVRVNSQGARVVTLPVMPPGTKFGILRENTGAVTFAAGAAIGTVTILGGGAGAGNQVTDVQVNGVSIISSPVVFTTNVAATAALLAAAINSFASAPEYSAVASGPTVYIIAATTGSGPNGFVVNAVTSGTVSVGKSNMSGGGGASILTPNKNVASRYDKVTAEVVAATGTPGAYTACTWVLTGNLTT